MTAHHGNHTQRAGHTDRTPPHLVLTTAPLDENALLHAVATPAAGAIVTFRGVVRDNSLGRKVRYLLYEAYQPMVLVQLNKLCQEVHARWRIQHIAIAHRLGQVEISDASVLIAVSSPHRREAIEACHYAIDRLKQVVPIWKKEFWHGGEVWVEHPQASYITRDAPPP